MGQVSQTARGRAGPQQVRGLIAGGPSSGRPRVHRSASRRSAAGSQCAVAPRPTPPSNGGLMGEFNSPIALNQGDSRSTTDPARQTSPGTTTARIFLLLTRGASYGLCLTESESRGPESCVNRKNSNKKSGGFRLIRPNLPISDSRICLSDLSRPESSSLAGQRGPHSAAGRNPWHFFPSMR